MRQVVHHVADSHANAFIRTKLALTEDWPTVKAYNEAAWARLEDSRLPVDLSLSLIGAACALGRAAGVTLAKRTSEGLQSSRARPQNLATALAMYDWHSRHHTAHIMNLRARQGW